ncbi:MAG: hypothetical protein JW750_10205 [Anaerolineaceae bacterium]|nr:hypothetical protein [Anaerolineaceae bacterium]
MMKKRFLRVAVGALLCLFLFLLTGQTVAAQSASIILDGLFDDWAGQACITDPQDDADESNDILRFCFAAEQSAGNLYFMVERQKETNKPLNLSVRLDINDNGSYGDAVDRSIYVVYNPNQNDTKVDVFVYDGGGSQLSTVTSSASWGEVGSTGASRVEFYAPLSVLGIDPGSAAAITMDVISYQGNSIDDGLNTPVQWTPADALGWGLLLLILIGASFFMAYRNQGLPRWGANSV